MFMVSEDERAAIQAAFEERGEWAAVMELRRHFPGIGDNGVARRWAKVIAGWRPANAATDACETR